MFFIFRHNSKYLYNSVLWLSLIIVIGFFILRRDINRLLSHNGLEKQDWNIEYNKSIEKIEVSLQDIMAGPFTLRQDDPKLIDVIRQMYLDPPSKKKYRLQYPNQDPSKGQSEEIRKLLGHKKNGFFIESGGLDGETLSNSLIFEKKFGWKGVLIEADPKNYDLILRRNRKCWSVPACLSKFPYPNTVMFQQDFMLGKISKVGIGKNSWNLVKVQCLPLYSILLALNTTKVDYFSLDVEGHELEVLKTIPWDKVNITTLSVEYIHGMAGKEVLRDYMLNLGYKVHSEVKYLNNQANDFIFFHPKLLNYK